MPTYEFRCPNGHEFEKFYRSISGAPTEIACPTCGKIAVRQLSGGAGLVFKGSGFYITDYGKDGKKPQTPATVVGGDGGSAKGGSETVSAKSDSKPSESKTSPESKPAAESKPRDSNTGTASKSAAKKSSGNPKKSG